MGYRKYRKMTSLEEHKRKMKDLKFKNLESYASSFVSFVLPKIDVEEIILFGSVARGEATEKSDVDLFFNTKENEKSIKEIISRELKKFYKSRVYETFYLKGIKNPISIEAGNLDEWKLKRSIISEGIVLYGKYKEVPEKMKGFVLFNLTPINNIAKRNNLIRQLFGRKEKNYQTKGIIDEINGKKLSPTSFIIPLEHKNKIIDIFSKEKIDYKLFEAWSDIV